MGAANIAWTYSTIYRITSPKYYTNTYTYSQSGRYSTTDCKPYYEDFTAYATGLSSTWGYTTSSVVGNLYSTTALTSSSTKRTSSSTSQSTTTEI